MKRITSLSLILFTSLSTPFSANAFEPPQTGSPSDRVGAGTRFSDDKQEIPDAAPAEPMMERAYQPAAPSFQYVVAEKVQLLATHKTALTASATPTLYWYVPYIPPYSVEITVQSKGKILLKKNIGIIKSSGMQYIRLTDYGVHLKAGKDYTWSVALIMDATQRNQDLLSNATIRYKKPIKPLINAEQMKQAGYWYDAVSQLIESNSPQLPNLLLQEGIKLEPVQNKP